MFPFRPARIQEKPEIAELQVFSAMHALVDRLAASAPSKGAYRHAEAFAAGPGAKHTPASADWHNGIVPGVGVIIP